MFLTRAVFEKYVAVPEGVTGQDEAGRLWDIVWMTRFGIRRSKSGAQRIPVARYVRNDNRHSCLVKLVGMPLFVEYSQSRGATHFAPDKTTAPG